MESWSGKLQIVLLGIAIAAVAASGFAGIWPAKTAVAVAPTPVTVTNAPIVLPINYRFKGFAKTAYTGGAGLITMNEGCAKEFGTNARVCTSQEVLESSTLPTPSPFEIAWVQPKIVGTYFNAGQGRSHLVDASGADFGSDMPGAMSCGNFNYSDSSHYGLQLVLTTNGASYGVAFHSVECDSLGLAACCTP